MSSDPRVPDDVKAWAVTLDAWLSELRSGEPHDELTDLKNALLDDVLERRRITPRYRPWPSAAIGPGSARADPHTGEPPRSDQP